MPWGCSELNEPGCYSKSLLAKHCMYNKTMVQFKWNADKNLLLKQNTSQDVCFEDIITAIDGGGLLDDVEHLNAAKYPYQRMCIVLHNNFVYGLPCIQEASAVFLKTIYLSIKLTAIYLKGIGDEN
jgi:hypothetical protein